MDLWCSNIIIGRDMFVYIYIYIYIYIYMYVNVSMWYVGEGSISSAHQPGWPVSQYRFERQQWKNKETGNDQALPVSQVGWNDPESTRRADPTPLGRQFNSNSH